MRIPLTLFVATMLASCNSGGRQPAAAGIADVVSPSAFGGSAPSSSGLESYRIGPSDKLALAVFQVPDLSFEEIFVDASGLLQLPLLGSVQAAGLTPAELARDIERRLGERYLRHPQVMITVAEAANQKVTVDGAVMKPGVYEMRGRTTLMQAVAMAEGASRVASLDSVAVFRTLDNRRMVAVFDLQAIRAGQAEDPVILGDDVVVVDTSRLSANLREIVQALPGLAVFGYF